MAEYYTDRYGVRRPILNESAAGYMSDNYEKMLQDSLGTDVNTGAVINTSALLGTNTGKSTGDFVSNLGENWDSTTTGTGSNITNKVVNPMDTYLNKEGLFGLTNNTWNNLGQAAGLAGSAYGLYDALAGNKADLYKQQIGMLKEQRAANQEMLANKRQFNDTWANASNGLAASYTNKGL